MLTGAQTLAYLQSLTSKDSKRVLTGHHLPEWESAVDGKIDYLSRFPTLPAILGTNVLTGAEDDYSFQSGMADRLAEHVVAGGLVVLDIHMANPEAPVGSRTIRSAWVVEKSAPKPSLTALCAQAEDSNERTAFWSQVDKIIEFLNRFPAGGAVIVRPFHEANNTTFWWGYDATVDEVTRSAQLVQLTTELRDYVVPKVQADLLWAHSGNGKDRDSSVSFGRPDWVDLVGASLYLDTLIMPNRHSNAYLDLVSTGKPVFLFEVGPDVHKEQLGTWDSLTIINMIRSTYPAVIGWQAWQRNDDTHLLSPTENIHAEELFSDPWSVNLADLNK